jgi:pimeloyl-ACP methyl ester carboxylesterase
VWRLSGCSIDRCLPGEFRSRPNPPLPFLLLVLLFTACGGAAGPPRADRLHPCTAEEGPTDAVCGTLEVFEDRASRTGRRIALRIVVLPALADDARGDPLFFLAGGPGQGAARMADAVQAAFRRVGRHRDIVLVDQRGTGHSNPLDCPSDTDTLQAAFADEEVTLRKLQECLRGLDADVRLYTTSIAMDDLDDVRRYLGYERVNLYGGSYGTRAALVYLRRHGSHVRSVVLDGAAPPDMRLPLYSARDAGRALHALLTACEADEACRRVYPGLSATVGTLLARLDAAPARVRLTHPRTGMPEVVDVTSRGVAGIIFGALYSPLTASMLPLLLERAESGDFQSLVALAVAGDASEQMSIGMQLSVLCSEDAPFITRADVARETAGSVFGVHLAESQLRACEAWPRGAVDPGFHAPVVSGVPALVLSGAIDPITPPSWGDQVVRHLARGRHLVAPATGHGVAGSGCGARLIADFIERADPEDLDTGCLETATRPPFFLTPAGPASAPARAGAAR